MGILTILVALASCGNGSGPADASDAETGPDADTDADLEDAEADVGDADGDEDAESAGDADADQDEDGDSDHPPWWGDPIEAPALEWTWIDFPETQCADGSPTGLGVNLSPGADLVLVYLEGGGACWDYASCFGVVPTSMHLGGFDGEDFEGLITAVYLGAPLFDRDEPKNAFADAHYVFVPYCTGDVFSGDSVVEMAGTLPWERETVHFHGHRNVEEFLARLVPTFQGVSRVVLCGSSAGGFGAGLVWAQAQEAFDEIRVDVLDDSGPPISPGGELWATWVETWSMQLPSACSDCDEGVDRYLDFYRETLLTTNRFGLTSYASDLIISSYFELSPSEFEASLAGLLDVLDEEPRAQYFVIPGVMHTLLVTDFLSIESESGMPLWRWIEQMVDDDPEWSSYRP